MKEKRIFITHRESAKVPGYDTLFVRGGVIDDALYEAISLQPPEKLGLALDEGEFVTRGLLFQQEVLYPVSHLSIKGFSRDSRIRLDNNAKVTGAYHYVFSNTRTIADLEISNIFIDCNWDGQYEQLDSRTRDGLHTKIGGLYFRAQRAVIKDVEILNFGAAAGKGNASIGGSEVFPLMLTGLNVKKETETALRIEDCRIHSQHSENGGYCTAIMVVPIDPYTEVAKQVQPSSLPGNWHYAEIKDCTVADCPNGIALGCANAQRVRFLRNWVQNCQTIFNCDTAHTVKNEHIEIASNRCSEIDQGFFIGAPGWGQPTFRHFKLQDNAVNRLKPTSPPLVLQGSTEDIYWAPSNSVEFLGGRIGE